MKRIILLGMLALFTITTLMMVDAAQAIEHGKMSQVAYTQSAVNLKMAMRKLWEDHITYTRNYIIRALGDLHLDYTTTEVVSRLKKKWIADIEAYDRGHDHVLMFADALTEGIIKQFPKKFV